MSKILVQQRQLVKRTAGLHQRGIFELVVDERLDDIRGTSYFSKRLVRARILTQFLG